jgi:putative PEP-CTERM system TPR-repeat lipoprotein
MNGNKGKRVLSVVVLLGLAACAPKGDALYARAEAAMQKGDARAAVIDLKNLVQSEPESARARALLGNALIATGDFQGGEIELQKARELGAGKELTLVGDCRVMVAKAEFDKVFADCKPEAGTAAQKTDLHVVTGNAYLGADRPMEAKAQFEAALAARPEDIDALLGKADAVRVLENGAAAKAVLDAAPAEVKENARYWIAIGALAMAENRLADAEAAYKTATEKVGKDSEDIAILVATGGLAEAQIRQGKVAEADATSAKLMKMAPTHPLVMQLRGQIAAAGGKLDEARGLLERVIAERPDNYDALTLLAIVNMQQGNMDQAEMHLSSVVANRPQDARAQRLLMEVRAKQGGVTTDTMAGIQSALQQTDNDPGMLTLASRASLATGDRAQALQYLAEASAKSSDNPQARLEVANGYLLAGDADKALEILNSIPSGGLAGTQRDSLLLLTLLQKKDEAQLMAQSKEILARSGKDPVVRNMVGSVYAAAGKTDLAREQFNEALKLKPNDQQSLVNLARLDLATNKPEAAEANFRKLLEAEPKNLAATLGLALTANLRGDAANAEKYLVKARDEHPQVIDTHLGLAQFYLQSNQLDKAREVIDAAAKTNPNNAAVANARGLVLMGSRDAQGAMAAFAEAYRLDPTSAGSAMNLARAQLVTRDPKAALATLDSILKNQPRYLPALALGAATSMQGGDLERAAGYVERVRQAAPNSPLSHQLDGDLAMSQKRFRDALASYEKADPDMKNRNITLARYQAATQAQVPQPEAIIERWLVANPNDADAVAVLAEHKRGRGDEAGALAVYQEALKRMPDNGVLNNNVAMIYAAKGDARALPAAEQAYKALPDAPAVADTYGWALYKAGKVDQAVEVLEKAVKGLPDNPEVLYHYAAALAKVGRKDEATRNVKKALGGTMPAAIRTDAQKLLAELTR